MKKHAYTIIALLVLVGSMAVAAQAQGSGRSELRADIPFTFKVGDKAMPAGEYTLIQINPSSDRVILQLRSKDGRNSAMLQMNNVIGKTSEGSQLVFRRYGSESHFAEAWTSSAATGLRAPKSKAERAARQELAGLHATFEIIPLTR